MIKISLCTLIIYSAVSGVYASSELSAKDPSEKLLTAIPGFYPPGKERVLVGVSGEDDLMDKLPRSFRSIMGVSEERKREIQSSVNLHFIDEAMQKITIHQEKIHQLTLENRRHAVGYASALIADKTPAWLEKQTSKGRFNEQAYYRAISNMMSFLSTLASDAEMNDAAKCHDLESRALYEKAQGGRYVSPGCRMRAYAHRMSDLIRWNKTNKAKPVKEIVEEWVKAVMFSSLLIAESNE